MLPKRFLFLANQNEIWIFLCKLQTLLVVSFTIFIYLFSFHSTSADQIPHCRTLLLTTIPVLIASLVIFVIASFIDLGTVPDAIISTICVVLYFCTFVMGYGPVPNILCAEIFPTRVRGLCIAICALVFWICDIIVTYTLPVLLTSIGLEGIFSIYAVVCIISWVFIYLKVPETKGMPLEVITEFFAVGARQGAASKSE